MANRAVEFQDYLRGVLTECGAKEINFTDNGNHPRVWFSVGGEDRFYVFPRTPSDSRSRLNARADLRRMCREMGAKETEMEHMNGTALRAVEPELVMSDEALSLYRVADDDEPRVRDIDLAVRLGMKNPKAIRQLIKTHWRKLNEINTVIELTQRHATNGTAFTEYYLDRRQSTFIAGRSGTAASDDVLMELVEVYHRWREGNLPMHPAATTNLATDAQLAILTQIRDGIVQTNESISNLKGDQSAMMDVIAGLESRLHAVEKREPEPLALPAPAADPAFMTLSDWCRVRGIDCRDSHHLGRTVGSRLPRVAKIQGVQERRVNGHGSRIYPTDFLDRHADWIREWLA